MLSNRNFAFFAFFAFFVNFQCYSMGNLHFSFFFKFSLLFNGKFAFYHFPMLFNENLRIEKLGGVGERDEWTYI